MARMLLTKPVLAGKFGAAAVGLLIADDRGPTLS